MPIWLRVRAHSWYQSIAMSGTGNMHFNWRIRYCLWKRKVSNGVDLATSQLGSWFAFFISRQDVGAECFVHLQQNLPVSCKRRPYTRAKWEQNIVLYNHPACRVRFRWGFQETFAWKSKIFFARLRHSRLPCKLFGTKGYQKTKTSKRPIYVNILTNFQNERICDNTLHVCVSWNTAGGPRLSIAL